MPLFLELSIILVITAAIAGFMKLLKQPIVVGYIISGIILGPYFLDLFQHAEVLNNLSEIGIAILLFIVGLHLSPNEVTEFGKSAFLIGFAQVALTFVLVSAIALGMDFTTLEAAYLGISLAFSSTIIVLKLISDKGDLEKLYSRISIGILLLQDIVAALALVVVSASTSGGSTSAFTLLFLYGTFLTLSLLFISKYILPHLSMFFANSQEYLFLFSLAWGLGLASLFHVLGFSIEIGALVAGVTLSISPFSQQISSKLKPLRDFFIVIFFVSLGVRVSFTAMLDLIFPVLVFSIFTLLAKPFIIHVLCSLFKYNKKTSFLASVSLAQISEFSMILALLGYNSGHISERTLTLVTLLGVITIAVSSYLAFSLEKIYPRISGFLKVFERKAHVKEQSIVGNYDVILFGCNRVGYDFIKKFKSLGSGFLCVDYDPDIVLPLRENGINCIYGDAESGELLEELNLEKTKLIISTIPDFEASHFLLRKIREINKDAIVILISYSISQALKYYDEGATYVILPHFVGGSVAADLASKSKFKKSAFGKKRNAHIKYLKERHSQGHAHPGRDSIA